MLNLMYFSPSNFGRYASQTEFNMDEINNTNESIETEQKSTANKILPLMSLTIVPPIMTTDSTTSSSVIKENIEPLPFPSHGPGPIQRPNKLSTSSPIHSPILLPDSTQSPSTPDVLFQINHLLDHQNSITPNVSNSSTLINDISTPNVPWTPFSSTEWSSKSDSSWLSSNISLATRMQNPFAQRQISKEESMVWSSVLTPSTSSNARPQQIPEWNELFTSGDSSSIDTTKSSNNTWYKFLPVSDPTSVDAIATNKPENETNNPFWNSINLNEWTKPPSDENNNDHDQSRWDFAR